MAVHNRCSTFSSVVLEDIHITDVRYFFKLNNPLRIYFEQCYNICFTQVPELLIMVRSFCNDLVLPIPAGKSEISVVCFYYLLAFKLNSREFVWEPSHLPSFSAV